MSEKRRPWLLLLEDLEPDLERTAGIAERCGFAVAKARTVAQAKEAMRLCRPAVLVVDISLAGEEEQDDAGWWFLDDVSQIPVHLVVVYSGVVERLALPLAAAGKSNFRVILKPDLEGKLPKALARAARELAAEEREAWIKESPADLKLDATIAEVAPTDLPVVIFGPTGAGKEMAAQEIALRSGRDKERIRTVNCGAFAEDILMSELFGHVRGAYTGADSHRLGLILDASGYDHKPTKGATKDKGTLPYHQWLREAENVSRRPQKVEAGDAEAYYRLRREIVGGTLILDEVAELTERAQAALLRVLDQRPIKPVGYDGIGFLPDVRIVSITNDKAKFLKLREDLRARLTGVVVQVPPIWERPETARGIVRQAIRNMGFRERGGQQIKPWRHAADDDVVAPSAWGDVMDLLRKMQGGVRELVWFAMRAAMLARSRHRGPVEPSDMTDAWASGLQWSEKSADPGSAGKGGDGTEARAVVEVTWRDGDVEGLSTELRAAFKLLPGREDQDLVEWIRGKPQGLGDGTWNRIARDTGTWCLGFLRCLCDLGNDRLKDFKVFREIPTGAGCWNNVVRPMVGNNDVRDWFRSELREKSRSIFDRMASALPVMASGCWVSETHSSAFERAVDVARKVFPKPEKHLDGLLEVLRQGHGNGTLRAGIAQMIVKYRPDSESARDVVHAALVRALDGKHEERERDVVSLAGSLAAMVGGKAALDALRPQLEKDRNPEVQKLAKM